MRILRTGVVALLLRGVSRDVTTSRVDVGLRRYGSFGDATAESLRMGERATVTLHAQRCEVSMAPTTESTPWFATSVADPPD